MSFVTNVTCAREVYEKFLSFFNTKGVFAVSTSRAQVTLVTDAGP